MKILLKVLPIVCLLMAASCEREDEMGDDGNPIEIITPDTYNFERDGASTISFSGQTTRISMTSELIDAMSDFDVSKESLLEMFSNQTSDGGDANPYNDTALNESTKSVKSKVAASKAFFSTNAAEGATIKADFEDWIIGQVEEVFPNEQELATPGVAGQVADGSTARYVNAQGMEYNQAVNKGLIGALMLDQILNNYLSPAVLDEADNRTNNDAGIVEDGFNYTTMEHKWDEAFGYLFGATENFAEANLTIGADDNFLNKYLGRVEEDADFSGIADDIFDAFKLGRAAIVEGDYDLRDEQAAIIKEELSKVIAIRAVYYMQQGKNAIPPEGNLNNYGSAFHDLSEGFGFVYSLRFTRQPDSSDSYFSKSEVNGFIADLTTGNGFWEVTPATLDAISNAIAAKFDFTVAQAAE